MWESPIYVGFNNRLSSFSRLILYDKRGTGISDPSSNPQLVAMVDAGEIELR